MSYSLSIVPVAQKALRKVGNSAFKRLTAAITELSLNSRPRGYKKLTGGADEHRIRVGSYRIIYAINDKQKKIHILAVGHRKDIYNK